ncbi:MAG: ABC transporter permease subunit, partial [Myxococcales bacterium]
MSPLRTLLRKELTDSLRDRRTLVMMLVIPVLLYPTLLLLIGFLTTAGKARLARAELPVGLVGEAALLLPESARPPRTPARVLARAKAEAALRANEIWGFVDAPAGSLDAIARGEQAKVELVYTKRRDKSMEAHDRLKSALQARGADFLARRLEEAKLSPTFGEPLRTESLDLDFRTDLGPLVASRMLPAILLVMLFMGALYPAIDVTAGEKERGTLETLLVAPVHPLQVMAAKYVTVAAIAVLAALLNLGAMALTFRLGVSFAEGV